MTYAGKLWGREGGEVRADLSSRPVGRQQCRHLDLELYKIKFDQH